MRRSPYYLALVFLVLFLVQTHYPVAQQLDDSLIGRSTDRQNLLVELYSSEACNNCPKADQWMSTLKDHPRLWKEIIPVIFHVDYWNEMGWKDPFSSSEYTARQKTYASQWRQGRLYTPAFVVNGKEWQLWHENPTIPLSANPMPVGRLSANRTGENEVTITFCPADQNLTSWKVYIAFLGFEIQNKVFSGENEGQTLNHDFVALHFQQKLSFRATGCGAETFLIPHHLRKLKKYGLAAWVSRESDPTPLQATGGYFPGKE